MMAERLEKYWFILIEIFYLIKPRTIKNKTLRKPLNTHIQRFKLSKSFQKIIIFNLDIP
jgi:hypothetical protein